MRNLDILNLLEAAESYSTCYEVFERRDEVIEADGIFINESNTVIESISYGNRILKSEDIIVDFSDDISWLL